MIYTRTPSRLKHEPIFNISPLHFSGQKSSLTQLKTYLSKNILVDINKKAGLSLDKKFAYLVCDVIQFCLFSLSPTFKHFDYLVCADNVPSFIRDLHISSNTRLFVFTQD